MTIMVMIGWLYVLISFAIMAVLIIVIAHYTNKNWGLQIEEWRG